MPFQAGDILAFYGRGAVSKLISFWTTDPLRLQVGPSHVGIVVEHFVPKGIAYDTGGALLSGTRVFKLTRLFPAAALNLVFCSELASTVLMRLGRMNVRNPAKYTPAALVRQLVRTGVYERVSEARDVISRAALSQAGAVEAA